MMQIEAIHEIAAEESTDLKVSELLGRILVGHEKVEQDAIEKIVAYARENKLRFGDAARQLGLISDNDLDRAMAEQFDYPILTQGTDNYPPELVAAFQPFSRKGQALIALRTALLQLWDGKENQSLAIVAGELNEGCSFIAANLAVVFSQLGQKTLLIDGDLLGSRVHQTFTLNNNVGLSAALVKRTPIKHLVKRLPLFRNLSIVCAGAPPPNTADILSRAELGQMLTELREQFDIIIVDTPPAYANAGCEHIARACKNALVIVRKNHTDLKGAEAMVETLRTTGTNIMGTVMTDY